MLAGVVSRPCIQPVQLGRSWPSPSVPTVRSSATLHMLGCTVWCRGQCLTGVPMFTGRHVLASCKNRVIRLLESDGLTVLGEFQVCGVLTYCGRVACAPNRPVAGGLTGVACRRWSRGFRGRASASVATVTTFAPVSEPLRSGPSPLPSFSHALGVGWGGCRRAEAFRTFDLRVDH